MKRLRTALVGLGRIGWQFHLPTIAKHPEQYDLVAVVDPLDARRDEAKAEYGVAGYVDLNALFQAEPSLDLLVIASPTAFHVSQTLAAFERGVDVFCDKPMALDLVEADRMIAGMQQYKRKLMIYQPRRCTPQLQALKFIIEKELLGPIYMLKRACSRYDRRNDWQAFKANGGGMLNNYGAHFIDETLYVAGDRAARVTCQLRTIASLGDADDVVKAVIETEKGILLDVDINMATVYGIAPWMVMGTRGTAIPAEGEPAAWNIQYFREDELPPLAIQDGLAAEARRYGSGEQIPWHEERVELAQFPGIDFYAKAYDYYALDQPPFVAVDETREVMRVLGLCRSSAAGN